MKKFTIISLMLVLVASFVFAAGLTPYVKTSNGVASTFVDSDVENKNIALSTVVLNGSIQAGAKDASGRVDVFGKIDAKYFRVNDATTLGYEKSYRKYFYPTDTTTMKYYPSGNDDKVLFMPAIGAEYYDNNLKVNLDLTYNALYTPESVFTMFGDYDKSFTAVVDAKYATLLNGSNNMVKVNGKETMEFTDDNTTTSTTYAAVNYYVPKQGTTTKATMDKYFDSVTKAYVFRGYGEGSYVIGAENGNLNPETIILKGTVGLDYFKYFANSDFNIGGYFTAKDTKGTEVVTMTTDAYAEYEYSVKKGANAKDIFAADACAEFENVTTKGFGNVTTVGGSLDVSIPRLIPVELYDNISLNLPMDFSASYTRTYDANADYTNGYNQVLSFTAKAYPVYVEFKDGAYSLFNKSLKTLTVYGAYGNAATFDADEKTNCYHLSAGAELALSTGTFAVDYQFQEAAEEKDNNFSLLTLSYKVSYKD